MSNEQILIHVTYLSQIRIKEMDQDNLRDSDE